MKKKNKTVKEVLKLLNRDCHITDWEYKRIWNSYKSRNKIE